MAESLTVTLSLSATRLDGRPFSDSESTSYNLTRDEFLAFQGAVSDLLLDFGSQANEAAAAGDPDPAPDAEGGATDQGDGFDGIGDPETTPATAPAPEGAQG